MAKLLFWGVVALVIGLVWQHVRRRSAAQVARRQPSTMAHARQPPVQTMVACAHCGLYQPVNESLPSGLGDGRYYCSEQHRERGPQAVASRR